VPHRRAHRAGEHEGLVISRGEAFEMLAQISPDDVGEGHGALACTGLRRTEGGPAAELLDQLPVDPDRAQLQVDVARSECGQFGPSQACEGTQEHERAISRIDRGGQGVDLGDSQDRPLRDASCPAPLIRQGLRRMIASSTAVLRIALSSRYALAVVTVLKQEGDLLQVATVTRGLSEEKAAITGAASCACGTTRS
jgi:hypothetical protein